MDALSAVECVPVAMKFDDFLKLIGDFGPYQRRIYVLLCLPLIFTGMQIMNPVFILHSPHHRCAIPGLENDTYAVQGADHQALIDLYIPPGDDDDDAGTKGSQYSKCSYYDIPVGTSSVNWTYESSGNDTGRLINASYPTPVKRACSKWVYDRSQFTSTVTSEENLVCDSAIYTAHSTTALMVGSLLGLISSGLVADRFGRKKAFMIGLSFLTVFSSLLLWMPSLYVFIAIRFAIGIGFGSFTNLQFLYAMEFVGTSKRTLLGIMLSDIWAFGMILHAGLAYGLRDWRHLQLATGLLYVPFLLSFWWLIPESPRWLISKQRTKEGERITRAMAKANHAELTDGTFIIEEDRADQATEVFWDIFRSRKLCLTTLVVFFNWFVCAMTYYGLTLNVGNLGGDLYLNYLFTSLMEFVAYLACIPALYRVGRKTYHIVCMMSSGAALLSVIFPQVFQSEASETITIVLSLFGKFWISAAFGTIYLWSTEMFPTVVRSTAMGIAAVCSAVGSISSPYVVQLAALIHGKLANVVPLLVFSGFSITAGVLALLLPETRNRKMSEYLVDMKNLSRSDNDQQHKTNSAPETSVAL